MGSFDVLSNRAALNAQVQLQTTCARLHSTLRRLSSGNRINCAADDPAGLSIADNLRASICAINQAQRNTADGFTAAQIADSALSGIESMLTRGVQLATESANGIFNPEERAALQSEWAAIKQEIARVSGSTNFNGISLLENPTPTSSELGKLSIFVGDTGYSAMIDVGLPQIRVNTSNGLVVFGSNPVEMPTRASVRATQSFDVLPKNETLTIHVDGMEIQVLLKAGDDRAQAINRINTALAAANANAVAGDVDGILQIDCTARGDAHTVSVRSDRSTGTGFNSAALTSDRGSEAQTARLQAGQAFQTLTADETVQIIVNTATVNVNLAAGESLETVLAKINAGITGLGATASTVDGRIVIETTATGRDQLIILASDNPERSGTGFGPGASSAAGSDARHGTVQAQYSFQMLDQDERLTLTVNGQSTFIDLAEGDDAGTVMGKINTALSTAGLAATAIEQGGRLMLETNATGADQQISVMSNRSGSGFIAGSGTGQGIDLSVTDLTTTQNSVAALAEIKRASVFVCEARGELGAAMNRLQAASAALGGQATSQQAAESGIRDANIASEISNLVRLQILTQIGIAALAQANANSSRILDLLTKT
jgi:flagellin